MAIEREFEQQRVWDVLYARLQEALRQFGEDDYTGDADYWMVSDNWGSCQHLVYVFDLKMLSPPIVARMQACVEDYPNWEIVVDVSPERYGQLWPTMSLIIRAHEIVDPLQREYFPAEFRSFKYVSNRLSDG
jgi:hypothetical protein